jgi:pimeloyl-ACP methyl ester carboxylesterase
MTEPIRRIHAIPGTLCAPLIFAPFSTALAARAQVETHSWMARSGPWDLESVADGIASRIAAPTTLVGHSTGGAIALAVALRRPELVDRLVLIDSGANMRGHGDVDAIIARLAAADDGIRAAIVDRSFATPLPDAVRAEMLAYAAGVPAEAAIEVLSSQRDTDFTPRLGELRVPTLILHGRFDTARTPADAEALAAGIPGARLRFLDAGHSPMYEVADQVAELVSELMA